MLTLNYRYRIYPSLAQEARMVAWLEACRGVYNYAVGDRKDWIKSRRCAIDRCSLRSEYIVSADTPYPNYYAQKRALTAAKQQYPELKDVQSQVLQDVIGRVESAFTAKKERGHGFPRFRKFGRYRSFLFPQVKADCIQAHQIKLPKLGELPIVLHRPIPDGFVIKTVRIIRQHRGWYATLCIQADVAIPEVAPHGRSLGIDVGLEYFLSTSDGLQVERPRFFAQWQRQLQLLQRRLKRKQPRSHNRAKLIAKIGRIHEQIAAARLDWQFKLAHRLCDSAQSIFVEDLDFRVMAQGMLGKHMLDAGLGQFINQVLPWVCFKRGVYYAKVDARGTSQECPDCGGAVKKDLSVRVSHCPECGAVKPRDIAAAQVINARGLSGVQTVCGWDLSGCEVTHARQDRVKQKMHRATDEARVLSIG